MMCICEDSDGESFQVTDVLEEKLSGVLPEGLEIVAEQSIFDHFCLIALPEELHDFISITHSQSLRFFQRVHEVEMKSLASIAN